MATEPTKIPGDLLIEGNLFVNGTKPALARSELALDLNARHKIQPTDWRVWDALSQPLLGEGLVEAAVEHVSQIWEPTSADLASFVAGRAYRVVGATARVEVAGTDGGAVTAIIKKAASGTDIASGVALHTGTINLKGTVDTNQVLTLSATSSDLDIAAGTAIGLDFTGTLTSARGCFTVLLAPAASPDDLILVGGTFGAASPSIRTRDLKAAGAQTLRARCTVQLPPSYVAGASVTIRARAGMFTTIADTSATIDFEAYRANDEAGIGSDLSTTTPATTINSVVLANKDFVITAASLQPGDTLDIRLSLAINDGATVTAVIGLVGAVELLLGVKG